MSQTLDNLKSGLACQKQGDLAQAESLFRQVLRVEPDNIHGLNLLGSLCVNSQRPQEAVDLIAKALQIRPEDPQALVNYALALIALQRGDEAEKPLLDSLRLRRQNPVALDALGNIYLDSNRHAEAEKLYKEALSLNQQFADCWCNLCNALQAQKKIDEAHYAARQALSLRPDNPRFLYRMAEVLQTDAKFDEAISYYQKAIHFKPDYRDAKIGLAHAYRQTEQAEAAMQLLDELLIEQGDNSRIVYAKAVLLEQLGNLPDAASVAQSAIDLAPTNALYHYQLAQLKGRRSSDAETAKIEALAEAASENLPDVEMLWYALGKIHDERGDCAQAFSCWQKANAIRASRHAYDAKRTTQLYRQVLQNTENALSRNIKLADQKQPPIVFVVGMPRSGNTLTGQIIASHSRVLNVGEVGHVSDGTVALSQSMSQAYPQLISDLQPSQIQQFTETLIRKYPQGDHCLVDNTPLNFQYIGLLALMLPGAKFVNCVRNPIDTCFSIYKLPFSGAQAYAHSLDALAHQYLAYQELMAGWQRLFPGRILNVQYETTVADTETQSRELLRFLDLPFEAGVLDFHQSKRLVRTPSASQVRQPIYNSAVAAWKAYETQLETLTTALEQGADCL